MTHSGFTQAAREAGADLVGIASPDRFEGLPLEQHPLAIKADTQSVVVLGFQVLRGSLRGIETGSSWLTFGIGNPATVAIESTYQLCRRLENDGWETVPLFRHSASMRHQGVAVGPDRPEPDVILDMDYAAFAAGLGMLGDGKFFLTPEYGPRQIFTALLTDLRLTPDPVQKTPVCDHCGACVQACPARALAANEWSEATGSAGTQSWRTLHIESCRICKTGTSPNMYSPGDEPNRLGAACGRACVNHLEQSGRLRKSLKTPFRHTDGQAGETNAC